jgi:hypothetical protein
MSSKLLGERESVIGWSTMGLCRAMLSFLPGRRQLRGGDHLGHDSASPAEAGIITGKIFEALGLGVPILVIAPHGSDVEAVVDNAGCGSVFSGSETEVSPISLLIW